MLICLRWHKPYGGCQRTFPIAQRKPTPEKPTAPAQRLHGVRLSLLPASAALLTASARVVSGLALRDAQPFLQHFLHTSHWKACRLSSTQDISFSLPQKGKLQPATGIHAHEAARDARDPYNKRDAYLRYLREKEIAQTTCTCKCIASHCTTVLQKLVSIL